MLILHYHSYHIITFVHTKEHYVKEHPNSVKFPSIVISIIIEDLKNLKTCNNKSLKKENYSSQDSAIGDLVRLVNSFISENILEI